MASFQSIAAAGRSLERFLNHCFDEEEPVPGRNTQAVLVRTADLEPSATVITEPALSIFLYRVDFNRTMRAAWSAVGSRDGRARLPLDLYFLLTPWADNADHELRILGKAMQSLETTPIFSGPLLDPLAGWTPQEALQVCLADISTEEPDAHLRLAAGRLPAERPLPGAGGPDRGARCDAGYAGDHADHRDRPRGAGVNVFVPAPYLERVTRLALGFEPLDAVLGGRLTHPVRMEVEGHAPQVRIDRHDSCLHVLLYQPSLADEVVVRIWASALRYTPRRLRIPLLTAGEAEDLPYTHRVRRPVLFPGAAYDANGKSTGLRGRVMRDGSPMRWARVEAHCPGAGP